MKVGETWIFRDLMPCGDYRKVEIVAVNSDDEWERVMLRDVLTGQQFPVCHRHGAPPIYNLEPLDPGMGDAA